MTSLIKAWLMDPLALLFLLSLALVALQGLRARRWRVRRQAGIRQAVGDNAVVGRLLRDSGSSRVFWLALLLWIALFMVSSAPLVVNPLIAAMEDPYLEGPTCSVGSHVVVLGGGVDSQISEVDEFGRMSNATLTRATQAAHLALAVPGTRVIVAGGAIAQIAEADVIAAYMEKLGLEPEQIIKEAEASNTRENAVNVARLLAEESIAGPVRLVTSAMHMPRALNSFRNVLQGTNIQVCAVSVDVQAIKDVPWYALMPQTTAIVRFERLTHEAVALLVYRLKGWL